MTQLLWSLDLTTHTSLSPIRGGFAPGFVNYKKGALDSQPQVIKLTSELLAHGQWFSPGTLASSSTKSGRHDVAEILLKMALKHQKSIKSNYICDVSSTPVSVRWSEGSIVRRVIGSKGQ